MCGIGLVLTAWTSRDDSISQSVHPSDILTSSKFTHEFQRRLRQRGPDQSHHEIRALAFPSTNQCGWTLAMHSAVLHLRGAQLTSQPVIDSHENILCWNGEIFAIMQEGTPGASTAFLTTSDTRFLSETLERAGHNVTQPGGPIKTDGPDPIIHVLHQVWGPFALIWLHAATQRIYFAHDRFGRRSLLYTKWSLPGFDDWIGEVAGTKRASHTFRPSELSHFILGNVATHATHKEEGHWPVFHELPVAGIYVLDLRHAHVAFHPYPPLVVSIPRPISPSPQASTVFDHFRTPLPCPATTTSDLDVAALALLRALSTAVGVRVRSVPSDAAASASARVALFFSGGLDSVVLAALTHYHVPAGEPIDLLTVCFDEGSHFASPDRQAAHVAHAELCALFPARPWHLLLVNVPRKDLVAQQREIQALMAPCDSHMDFNIGAAFWFLARGQGTLMIQASLDTKERNEATQKPARGSSSCVPSTYQTRARVVLVGIGADEQLAGYGRHRTTLRTKGEAALRAELKMEMERLWKRNLGRDDRCIAAHGREARFPYLDEAVVATIARFPLASLCDAALPRGKGEKRVLRVVAELLGLHSCVDLAKRAIQFGSRIAKVSTTGSYRQTQGSTKFARVD
ncbi:hypothetical protein PsorP6_010394 [Peronosclerospora sorghi]|uniref:Uncharacterized protein n=1 Tax=Peronosclerospora sorghi TaxID=230839 RepID=A0ACC0VUN5_9STRA|nr:hypothetical protein PsorP6_010394 [Peronosclerospora sorghi]